jgi:hypothetical protein
MSQKAYENIANSNTKMMQRIVVPILQKKNEKIRRDYVSVFREPCIGIVPSSISMLSEEPVEKLHINKDLTVLEYASVTGSLPGTGAGINANMKCFLAAEKEFNISLSFLGNNLYFKKSGTIRFVFDVVMEWPSIQEKICTGSFCTGGLGIYLYNGGLMTDINDKPVVIPGVIDGKFIRYNNLDYNVDVFLRTGDCVWIGGYGFVNIVIAGGSFIYVTPPVIDGSINCQYIKSSNF